MADQHIDLSTISVSQAREDDLPFILRLFDEAVIWLNQQGIEKQWGTEPFSDSLQIQERFMNWIKQGVMFVAHLDGRIVGSLALSAIAPSYIVSPWASLPASAYYLEAFVTSRSLVGQNIGRVLLNWAENYTREAGKTAIWLDCWGENAVLVNYYRRMGFVPHGEFMVKEWRGQLFEKKVAQG